MEELQKHFDDNRDSIIAKHENEFALISKNGKKFNVTYFDDIQQAVNEGSLKYGYGNFVVCHCVSLEDSMLHFVNV